MLWAWLDFLPSNADLLTADTAAVRRLAALLSLRTLPPFRERDRMPDDDDRLMDARQEVVQCAVGLWWGCSSRVSAAAVERALAAGIGEGIRRLLRPSADSSPKARFCASGTLAAWVTVAPAAMRPLWEASKKDAVSVVQTGIACLLSADAATAGNRRVERGLVRNRERERMVCCPGVGRALHFVFSIRFLLMDC